MARRIIPVSSGKGGVGKTTFAINFALALSRVAPTILVDLDTGTSSVRNTLSVDVGKDLYHFHRKGEPLENCVHRLDESLDPSGHFSRFGFVAGPKHFIEDLANPDRDFRRRIAREINLLPAEYVVVDLRAGVDSQVIDFLPYTNSGVLVFAPHHPAAVLAAADIVKAIIFRSLRFLFAEGSKFYRDEAMRRYRPMIGDLLDRVEDVYDESIPNLDAFLVELEEAFGHHPILGVIAHALETFRVHYVLNMFNGVEESYEEAVEPFVRNLAENVSTRLHLTPLGWIVYDPRVHRANCTGRPILLGRERVKAREAPVDPVLRELAELESSYLGLDRRPRTVRPRRRDPEAFEIETQDLLAGELSALKSMFAARKQDMVRENFAYIAHRALGLMGPHMATSEFGQTALAAPEQLEDWFLRWQNAYRGGT